jgi:hypothetical protein
MAGYYRGRNFEFVKTVNILKTRALKNTIFSKKRVDMWWCGAAAPPHIQFFFTKKTLSKHPLKTMFAV